VSYLIDTDIIIYSLRGNEKVQSNFRIHQTTPKAISVISFGELVFGAKKSSHKEKNIATVHRIGELFPVIDITRGIVETYAEIKASLQRTGKVVDDLDLLIGATALFLNYTLVTNNEKHFSMIPDLSLANWSK